MRIRLHTDAVQLIFWTDTEYIPFHFAEKRYLRVTF